MDVGLLSPNQKITLNGKFIAYLVKGSGIANENLISDGDLIRGNDLEFQVSVNTEIILIQEIEK